MSDVDADTLSKSGKLLIVVMGIYEVQTMTVLGHANSKDNLVGRAEAIYRPILTMIDDGEWPQRHRAH